VEPDGRAEGDKNPQGKGERKLARRVVQTQDAAEPVFNVSFA
jgi:hypothetical protein